jgi:hypothetical protein
VIDHCEIDESNSTVLVNTAQLKTGKEGIILKLALEVSMFSTPYPTIPQVQAYAAKAHRLRGAVVATLIRDVARWISSAAR